MLYRLKKENQKKLFITLGLLDASIGQSDEKVGMCPECEHNKYDIFFRS